MSDPIVPLFGWIHPAERTERQWQNHYGALGEMPRFRIAGATDEEPEKVDLTELWSHPSVMSALGFAFPGIHQYTGSCVGAGGGNAIFTLLAVEVIRLRDPAQIVVPFWLLPYGRSRYYMGDRGRGEGSLGSTFAKAAKEDGVVDAAAPTLPRFKLDDGLSWFKDAEYSWSDGDAPQTMSLLPESRKHVVRQTAPCQTADDVEQAIRNYYPVTNASSLIPSPRVEDDGEAYGRVSRGGGHQTTFLGVWRHPKKGGRWFKYQNQWGLGWGKAGACWIPEADVEAIIRNGEETYAFSQFTDFPAQTLDWSF